MARVTVDVFSGRPNPDWELASDAEEELRRRLEEEAPVSADEPPGLGYRGMVVELDGRVIHIYGHSDLERWLLQTAPALDPSIQELVESSLRAPGET